MVAYSERFKPGLDSFPDFRRVEDPFALLDALFNEHLVLDFGLYAENFLQKAILLLIFAEHLAKDFIIELVSISL